MIKWEALSRPKEFGGLGRRPFSTSRFLRKTIYVRVMNTYILSKWIDKLERGSDNLCFELLRRKYLGQKSIFQIKNRKGSRFWKFLLDVRFWYQKGRKVVVKSRTQTSFWHDCWFGDCPLEVRFHKLYQIAFDPDIEVAKAFVNSGWSISFRR